MKSIIRPTTLSFNLYVPRREKQEKQLVYAYLILVRNRVNW